MEPGPTGRGQFYRLSGSVHAPILYFIPISSMHAGYKKQPDVPVLQLNSLRHTSTSKYVVSMMGDVELLQSRIGEEIPD